MKVEYSEFALKSAAVIQELRKVRHEIMGASLDISNVAVDEDNVPIYNAANELQTTAADKLHGIYVDMLFAQEVGLKQEKVFQAKIAELESQLQAAEIRTASAEQNEAAIRRKMEERLAEHNPANPDVRSRVLALTDGKCAYCGCEISSIPGDGRETFIVEHVVPKSAGGPDHLHNYVPACLPCNSSKHAAHVIDFIRKRSAA